MPTYDGIGETITHKLELEGDMFLQDIEGGSLSTQVPLEIFSDFGSSGDNAINSRMLRLRVQNYGETDVTNSYVTDFGIRGEADKDYFFITAPQNTSNVGDQNTFVISKTSNVGIGTTDPGTYRLLVNNSSTKQFGVPGDDTPTTGDTLIYTEAGEWVYAFPAGNLPAGSINNEILTWNGTNWVPNSSIITTNSNTAIGIGTYTPSSNLHVIGSVTATSDVNISGAYQGGKLRVGTALNPVPANPNVTVPGDLTVSGTLTSDEWIHTDNVTISGNLKCQTLTASDIVGGSPLTISATSIAIQSSVTMPADAPMSIGTMTVSNIFHSDQLTMSANIAMGSDKTLTTSNITHGSEITLTSNLLMGSDKTLTTSNITHASEVTLTSNLLMGSDKTLTTSNIVAHTGDNLTVSSNIEVGNVLATGTLSATELIGSGAAVTNVAAATSVKLATARAINGVNFDGTAAITVNGLNYNVNDQWLRELGDNANFKIYGNSRQIAFRTDGTTQYASDIGGYPFAWMYGGDAASQRLMLLDTAGNLWCKPYGWLHDNFAYKAGTSGQNFNANAVYVHEWLRINSTGATGIYWNNSSGTGYQWHIYPKSQQDMYFRTGASNGGIAGTVANEIVRGYIHWTTANEIGFLNSSREWTLRCDNSKNVQIYGNLYISSSRYLGNITGDYGTVQCNGGGANGWEGYSIDGRVVFMHDGGSAAGIYNDVDNHWLFYGVRQAETRMYYNGSEALRTYSEGIRINQRMYISSTSQTYNTSWANAPSQGDTRGTYIIMVQGATNDISCAIFACTDDSGFDGGNVAVLQRSTDYYSGSAYFDCQWPGSSYIQLRHTTTTRACYVTVFRTA